MERKHVRVKVRSSEKLDSFCLKIVEIGDIKQNPLLKRVEQQESEMV